MIWGICFSSKISPAEVYGEYSVILLTFPSWTPDVLKRLTLSERKYWAQWSRASYERDHGEQAPVQTARPARVVPGTRGSFGGRPVY